MRKGRGGNLEVEEKKSCFICKDNTKTNLLVVKLVCTPGGLLSLSLGNPSKGAIIKKSPHCKYFLSLNWFQVEYFSEFWLLGKFCFTIILDGVGPVDNRPSTDKLLPYCL